MQAIYYTVPFVLSLLLTFCYCLLWHSQLDQHMSLIFILMPIANLSYMLIYTNHEAETAQALLKICYIGGCYMPWLVTLCVFGLCQIKVSRMVRMGSLLLSTVVFASVLSGGYSPIFYKSMRMVYTGIAWVVEKEYGPLHKLHYVCIVLYLVADLAAIFYTAHKKKQVSRRVLLLLFIPILVTILGYLAGHDLLRSGFELTPYTYVLAQGVYLIIAHRMALHNVSEMVIATQVRYGRTGYITVDARGRYLGSNETAKQFLPELNLLRVDQPVREEKALSETVSAWLDRFQKNREENSTLYACGREGETICLVTVSDLFDGRRSRGCQILLQDDTRNQQYIRLLDRYNTDLQAEVAAKTEKLTVMHDRLILGMAAMVESRDNSTGGHIRRTSEGVRILIEAIRQDKRLQLPESFCRNIIKAAPMHDLGKIAVDDAVLRKPGRFTPEEFELMKSHAAQGAKIVHSILQDTEDEAFRRVAENVAHYHHERVDGSGYPDGLKGDEIPLEARIMAIADVYDALVSKRVYKEAFSFQRADQIIREGMGTQFDSLLEPYYRTARPKLEAYYAALEGNT